MLLVFSMNDSEDLLDHVQKRSSASDMRKANVRFVISLMVLILDMMMFSILLIVGIFKLPSGDGSTVEMLLDPQIFITINFFILGILFPFFIVIYLDHERKVVIAYRKAEEITGVYWYGHPKCKFLDINGDFTCKLTPDDPFILEEIGTCHLNFKWRTCWSEKIPRMRSILSEKRNHPGIISNIAWSWSEMELGNELCHPLLDELLPITVHGMDENLKSSDMNDDERDYRWDVAFDNAVHALVKNNCFSPQAIWYLLSIANSHARDHPIIDEAIERYFKMGKDQCTPEIIAWFNEHEESLDEQGLLRVLSYLAVTSSTAAVNMLQTILSTHDSSLVKGIVAGFLVDIGTSDSLKALVMAATDHSSDHVVKMEVIGALSSLSGSQLHHLIMFLDDDDFEERRRDDVLQLLSREELSASWDDHLAWLLSVDDGDEILEDELLILKRYGASSELINRLLTIRT